METNLRNVSDVHRMKSFEGHKYEWRTIVEVYVYEKWNTEF